MQINKNLNALFSIVSICCFSSYGKLEAVEPYDIMDYKNQLYSDVTTLQLGVDTDGLKIFYKVQNNIDNPYLYLGPNEVFFRPTGILRVEGEEINESLELNQGKEFSYIRKIIEDNAELEWSFITNSSGNIHADLFFSATPTEVGSILSFQIDDNVAATNLVITEDMVGDSIFELDFLNVAKGIHTFKIKVIKTLKKSQLSIFNVRLSGQALLNSFIIRERWRPEAAYSNWSSSQNPNDVQAWIMELSSNSRLGHFSPCTTEFGYFGPGFDLEGRVDNVNMAIWSSGENKPLLPLNLRSHILGIGSSKGEFETWNTKEGTGAKVRKWPIFEDNVSRKYVIGLRYTNDGDFTTFYGYFWNEITNNWQLYCVGRKFKDEPVTDLKTKAFIEVVGSAGGERSNHVPRIVNYKGFVCDSVGNWSDLDQLILPGGSGITNQRRGIAQDRECFFTKTGGLANKKAQKSGIIKKAKIINRPLYMDPSKLEGFFTLPFIPQITSATLNSNNLVTLAFKTNTELESTVTICWGTQDAVTIKENWEHSMSFTMPSGQSNVEQFIDLTDSADAKFFRILVQDANAQMWNFETQPLNN